MLNALHAAWYMSTAATDSPPMLPAVVSSSAMATDSHTDASCTVVALVSADCAVSAAARLAGQAGQTLCGASCNPHWCRREQMPLRPTALCQHQHHPRGRRYAPQYGGRSGWGPGKRPSGGIFSRWKHGQGPGGIAPAHIAQL